MKERGFLRYLHSPRIGVASSRQSSVNLSQAPLYPPNLPFQPLSSGGHYVVLSGLSPGDVVVTEGSFLLRAESARNAPSG